MKIKANDYFKRVEDITSDYLASHNIVGILLDIDNTIVVDGETAVSPTVRDWIENIGLPICLISNGREERVKQIACIFGLNYVYKANKPSKKGYEKAAGLIEAENFSGLAVIGDQLFSDILGGNLVDCHTIKVEPLDMSADPVLVKIKRWFERFVA